LELIDVECRELLGLAGTRIFSNLQLLCPDLNLEDVLQRREPPPPGTPDRAVVARAARLDIALRRLQAIYARPGTSAVAGQESSSSDGSTSSGESSGEEAEEADGDDATGSSGETSSGSSHSTGGDEGSKENAQ
jgi:hypothetical protein